MQESHVQSLGQEDPLEMGMATHSSILAWRIPWTGEPAGYSPWSCKELDMIVRSEPWNQAQPCMQQPQGQGGERRRICQGRGVLWARDWFSQRELKLMAAEQESPGYLVWVTQSCPTLHNSMDWSPPGPLSLGISRQEYWSGVPFPSPGDLHTHGWHPVHLQCRQILYLLSHQGSPSAVDRMALLQGTDFLNQAREKEKGLILWWLSSLVGQFSLQSQRKEMTKNAQTPAQLHSSHTLVK